MQPEPSPVQVSGLSPVQSAGGPPGPYPGLYPPIESVPPPPYRDGNELNKEKGQKRAVKLWSAEPVKNQHITDKTAQPHRNCETVEPPKIIQINDLREGSRCATETVKGLWETAKAKPELLHSSGLDSAPRQ